MAMLLAPFAQALWQTERAGYSQDYEKGARSMMSKRVSRVASVVVVALVAASPSAGAVKEGKVAPSFEATTFDGAEIKLSDFKGDVLVINIWATWCGPCKKELPLLDSFFQILSTHGLRVIAITTEDSVPLSKLKPLQTKLAFPMVRRFRGPYAAIGGAVPSNFVIDRRGIVRYAKAGAFDLDALNAVLIPLLKEPREGAE
jgi:cytochrome c biogenesis protein CcmG, thiol:disulfide interchange protein DsbE